MNRHVGASFTLSVLVVVFFAVVLYQPEHARRSLHSGPPGRGLARPSSEEPGQAPPPSAGVPLSEATAAHVSGANESSVDREATASTSGTPRFPPRDPSDRNQHANSAPRTIATSSPGSTTPDPPAMIQIVSRRRALASPRRSAFTQVGQGESLTDVAIRVYGTSDATRTLWLANRDIIDRRDASLREGMLLRTP